MVSRSRPYSSEAAVALRRRGWS